MEPVETKPNAEDGATHLSQSAPSSDGNHEKASQRKAPAFEHGATGPRTTAGKRRSSRNSLKSGIFARPSIMEGESSAYKTLLNGLLKYYRPQGILEISLVEDLSRLLWRRRRFTLAEDAEISTSGFNYLDSINAQKVEAWDRSRAAETSGGMLRDRSNPFILNECIQILTGLRDEFEKSGFQANIEPWLRKLYGLAHDGSAPDGISSTYLTCQKLATMDRAASKDAASKDAVSPDGLKVEMLELFDKEIEHLKKSEKLNLSAENLRRENRAISGLIPSADAMDRFIRYEAHLSREFDRILNRLERLQRFRRGQPALPTLNVEVSG